VLQSSQQVGRCSLQPSTRGTQELLRSDGKNAGQDQQEAGRHPGVRDGGEAGQGGLQGEQIGREEEAVRSQEEETGEAEGAAPKTGSRAN